MKTNKIWSSIKKNKVKIGIISAGLAGIITTGALCGTLGISKTAEQLDSVKTHVYDGTIKFDNDGKIIIPKLIDPDNPSGEYKHKIPNLKIEKYKEFKDDKFYNNKLNDLLKENKKILLDNIGEYKDKDITLNKNIILFLNNLIPNTNLKINETVNVGDLVDTVYEQCTVNLKEEPYSVNQLGDLAAINGVNLNKIYNDLEEEQYLINHSYSIINFKGDGKEPKGNKVSKPKVKENKKDVSELTLAEFKELLEQDYKIRFAFNVAYTVLSIVLAFLSFILGIFGGGASLVSLLWDLTCCLVSSLTMFLDYGEGVELIGSFNDCVTKIQNDVTNEATMGFINWEMDKIFKKLGNKFNNFFTKLIKIPNKFEKSLLKLNKFKSVYVAVLLATVQILNSIVRKLNFEKFMKEH